MSIRKRNTQTERAINYEIVETYAERELDNGSILRVAEVSWNGRPAKFDIRKWIPQDDGTEKCGKGIALDVDEINMLKDMLNDIDED